MAVVPVPINGSKTISPGSVVANIQCSTNSSGNGAGCGKLTFGDILQILCCSSNALLKNLGAFLLSFVNQYTNSYTGWKKYKLLFTKLQIIIFIFWNASF